MVTLHTKTLEELPFLAPLPFRSLPVLGFGYRFYAVFYHLYYKTERHRYFVVTSLVLCWFFSAGLTLPAVVGFRFGNETCFIDSPDFMLYGSIFAFYIPCAIMFITYGFVFYKLNKRFKTVRQISMSAEKAPNLANGATTAGPTPFLESMLMNVHGNNAAFRRNTLSWAMPFISKSLDSDEIMEETDSVSSADLAELTTIIYQMESTTQGSSDGLEQRRVKKPAKTRHHRRNRQFHCFSGKKGRTTKLCSNFYRFPRSFIRRRQMSVQAATEQLKRLKFRAFDMFARLRTTQGKAIRKETKATKLVTTVLVVFLICWLPFFALNTTKAIYLKTDIADSWPKYADALFTVFTWLGYFNSCINPFIYSVLNTRFRDAFKRILGCTGDEKRRAEQERRRRQKTICLKELHMRSLDLAAVHANKTVPQQQRLQEITPACNETVKDGEGDDEAFCMLTDEFL